MGRCLCSTWYHIVNSQSLMSSCCLVCLLTSKQSNGLKRKLQSPHGNPPLKRKRKPSVNTFRKCATEADIREKGTSSQISLPKKQLTNNRNESQKSKPFIKTSSLFKNNPDIPEIHRYFRQMGGKKPLSVAWNSVSRILALGQSSCLVHVVSLLFM